MKGINELIEKIRTDKSFAEKYKDMDTAEKVVEQAKADGYTITIEDVDSRVCHTDCGECSGKTELSGDELHDVVGGNSFGWTSNNWNSTECSKIKKENFRSEGVRCRGSGFFSMPCDHYTQTKVGSIYIREVFGEAKSVSDAYNHKCGYGKFDFDGYPNGSILSDHQWIAK